MEANNVEESSIDFKKWISLVLSNWYLYVLFFTVLYSATLIYKRYAVNLYNVRSSVLVKGSTITSHPILQSGYFSTKLQQKNLNNEINIVKSVSTVREVVEQLDMKVSYFLVGSIRNTELYPHSPIKLVFDTSSTSIPYNITFQLNVVNNNEFSLKLKDNKSFQFAQKKYRFGEPVHFNSFEFQVIRTNLEATLRSNESYLFKINNLSDLVSSYRTSLQVAPMDKESSILVMTLSSTHPPREIAFLNKLASVYIKESNEERNFSDNKTIEFINFQMGMINDTLDKIESNIKEKSKELNVFDIREEGSAVYEKIKGYEEQLEKYKTDQKYFNYLKNYLTQRSDYTDLIVPASVGMSDPMLSNFISQIVALQMKKNIDFKLTNPNSPFYKDNELRIQEIKKNIVELIKNIESNNRIFVEDLNHKINRERFKSFKISDSERENSGIKRMYDVNMSIFNFLLQKRVEASINKAANAPDIRVVDQASVTGTIRPNHDSIRMYAIILGILLPTLIIVSKELMNDKVRHRDDISSLLRMPFLGVVGHNHSNETLVVTPKSKSAISESFRSIRSNLQFFLNSPEKKTILVTSSVSGEGKTFTSINISLVLAISGKKTVLIGADMRKPKLFDEFGLKNDFGLSNYLVGRGDYSDIIQNTEIENLSIVTSGPIPPNPSELILSPRMEELINKLKEQFDYIIIDSPPIGLVTDASILMRFTDSNIYVIRNNYSTKDSVKYVAELYNSGKIKNMSLLMNDVVRKDGYNYGYSYGHGYGYGYYSEDLETVKKKNKFLSFLLPQKKKRV
ncbi:MAG TPA: hypothetical protein DCR46_08540 [Cytophagales bacterium]|nr:hypothetical protein [Cytophagales bacterium]